MKYLWQGLVNFIIGLILIAIVAIGFRLIKAVPPTYKVKFITDTEATTDLNGIDDWEIISARRALNANAEKGYEFILKK